jgi:hypothetical protein
VPFPANYGGVIDVYYKLLWLKQAGVRIHLHCFQYGRPPSAELEVLCEKVYYYPRRTGILANLSLTPYTVMSRRSPELEKNLLTNDFPILFEVLHTCSLMNDPRFRQRLRVYRHSNIEHHYYRELARSEKHPVRKLYLRIEAWKLQRFEPVIQYADLILAVNRKDTAYFRQSYPDVKSLYLPSFHANDRVSVRPGKGDYILFHGNLSVSENYESAAWLIRQVFSHLDVPVIIAGLNPPRFLKTLIAPYPHIRLEESPAEEAMTELVAGAQVHVLHTAQPTGLKLKLLNVLFKGRFVICNDHMISGTSLKADTSLRRANTPEEFISGIRQLYTLEFEAARLREREEQVEPFSNRSNVALLIRELFGTKR